MKNRYTKEESSKIMALHDAGKSNYAIGRETGRTTCAIDSKIRREKKLRRQETLKAAKTNELYQEVIRRNTRKRKEPVGVPPKLLWTLIAVAAIVATLTVVL